MQVMERHNAMHGSMTSKAVLAISDDQTYLYDKIYRYLQG